MIRPYLYNRIHASIRYGVRIQVVAKATKWVEQFLSDRIFEKHNASEKDSGYFQRDKRRRPFLSIRILVNIMHRRMIQVIPQATKLADYFLSNPIHVNIMHARRIQVISKATEWAYHLLSTCILAIILHGRKIHIIPKATEWTDNFLSDLYSRKHNTFKNVSG